MNSRVQELFEQLCDLPMEERVLRLSSLDEKDKQFAHDVKLLLGSQDSIGRFLSEATAAHPRSNSNVAHVAEQAGDENALSCQKPHGDSGMWIIQIIPAATITADSDSYFVTGSWNAGSPACHNRNE